MTGKAGAVLEEDDVLAAGGGDGAGGAALDARATGATVLAAERTAA